MIESNLIVKSSGLQLYVLDTLAKRGAEKPTDDVVKKELSQKAKLSIYRSVYIRTLPYGHELWLVSERMRSQIEAVGISFLTGWLGSAFEIG